MAILLNLVKSSPVHSRHSCNECYIGEIVHCATTSQKLLAHHDAAGTSELSDVAARSQGMNRCSGHAPSELVSSRVNTELKCIFNSSAIKIPVLLYSRNYPPVVLPYLEHFAYFLYTHKNSYCLILYFVLICAQNFA